jgi:hypothetical protein
LMFSMPPGTPPNKVLAAVENFAREEFGMQHRYVMALHTDEPHPHVHVLVKAMSEQGVRLNIRKATLRMWRSEFARHLRDQGVRANATERLARGRIGRALSTEVYRGNERGSLTRIRPSEPQRATGVEQTKPDWSELLAEIQLGWDAVTMVAGIRSGPDRRKRNLVIDAQTR